MTLLQRAALAISLVASGVFIAHAEPRQSVTSSTPTEGDPAVVAILEDGAPICTGTVIAPRAVITAGHCVRAGHRLTLTTGPSPQGTTWIPVEASHVHPAFDRPTLANDVAVLIAKSDLGIEPASRAAVGALPADLRTSPVRLVGYGFVSIEDHTQLKREGWSSVSEASDTQIRLSPSPSQPCLGDSGGPVFITRDGGELLVGTVSWGDQRCSSFAYAQRVDSGDPFVDETLAALAEPPESSGCAASGDHGLAPMLLIALAAVRRSRRPRPR